MNYKLSRSQFQLLVAAPLIFFLAQAIHYWQINELGHTLWMCNIGNLYSLSEFSWSGDSDSGGSDVDDPRLIVGALRRPHLGNVNYR